jgi:hypothetical protein
MRFFTHANVAQAGVAAVVGGTLLVGLSSLHAEEVDDSNPYSVIMTRNVFHLNPPPPPPSPEKPKVELPTVKITGIMHVAKKTQVMFVSESKDHKDHNYYTLTAGERSADGKLELVRILPQETGVDVINDGVAATLTTKEDSNESAKISGGQTAGNNQPPPNNPGQMPGRPMFQNRPTPPGMQNIPGLNNFPGIPTRARRNLPPGVPGPQ